MRDENEAERAVELYADMVRRICFLYLKNTADAEDIFQTVFLKYVLYSGSFENETHERAWLARVTINSCKDTLKSFFHRRTVPLEEAIDIEVPEVSNTQSEVLEAVMKLPQNYRTVIYLSYYEGYTAVEIGRILNKKENTIYTWISRAKGLLRERLGGEALV